MSKRNRFSSHPLRFAVAPDFGRRRFVQGLGASLVGGPILLATARAEAMGTTTQLFTLGVASGDPSAHSVVLWTRLAPEPLDGGGLRQPVRVDWKVARDPSMRHVIRRGVTVARSEHGHAVHVVADGLPSNAWLYYQFHARGQASRVGRTRTFPACSDDVRHMRFALTSCQNYTAGYYTAYRDMATQDLDFVVQVGDYIYESGASSSPDVSGRNHRGGEIFSVDDYRNRYALYRLDADLQEAHARFPFVVVWDDHEVDNDYAGRIAEEGAPYVGEDFLERRRNAYRVYAESMPLRPRNRVGGVWGFLPLYRQLSFGSLANLFMLDSRQFRSDQPAEGGFGSPDEVDPVVKSTLESTFNEVLFDGPGIHDPESTMLGRMQEDWLSHRLRRTHAHWNLLAQGTMVVRWNLVEAARQTIALDSTVPPPVREQVLAALSTVHEVFNVDAWDGYLAAQQRMHRLLERVRPSNPVFLTGDIHSAWGANLLADYEDPNSDVVAAEFVCTSLTSTFASLDPRPTDTVIRFSLTDNPHVEFFNGLFRGYTLCDVDETRWRAIYRGVGTLADLRNPAPDALVPRPASPVEEDAVLEIDSGFNRRHEPQRLRTIFTRIPNRS